MNCEGRGKMHTEEKGDDDDDEVEEEAEEKRWEELIRQTASKSINVKLLSVRCSISHCKCIIWEKATNKVKEQDEGTRQSETFKQLDE